MPVAYSLRCSANRKAWIHEEFCLHDIPTLTTDRLVFRGFEQSDLDAYALMMATRRSHGF